jgi:hypothetical protein
MPTTPRFAEFEARARALGFDEALVREWAPNAQAPEHTHPFAVQALVVRGELWLSHGGSTQHLPAGSRFELDAGVPHSERYGDVGATFWVARRHPVPPEPAAV